MLNEDGIKFYRYRQFCVPLIDSVQPWPNFFPVEQTDANLIPGKDKFAPQTHVLPYICRASCVDPRILTE